MAQANLPIPVLKALRKLGADISDARRRRRIPTKLLAERADISPRTLSKIEKGEGGVAMSSYASVLFALGMLQRLQDVADAAYDQTGREIEEANLPKRVRLPQKKDEAGHE
jgi:transcriptional regulator with XRE-family HTH domain